MTEADILAAFDAAFLALTGIGDKATQGQVYVPQAGRPWAKSRMSAISKRPIGFSADCPFWWDGIYQIKVSVPLASGQGTAGRLAAIITAAFPRGLSLTVTVAAGTNGSATVAQSNALPALDDGDWITVPVTVQWFASDP